MNAAARPRFVFESDVSTALLPFLEQHVVDGRVIFPGAGFVEMAIAAAFDVFGGAPARVACPTLLQPLFLDEGAVRRVTFTLAQETGGASFTIESCDAGAPHRLSIQHVAGRVDIGPLPAPPAVRLDDLRSSFAAEGRLVEGARFYERFAHRGNDWGPFFQGVRRAWMLGDEVLAHVVPPDGLSDSDSDAEFHVHPALLDAALQAVALGGADIDDRTDTRPFVGAGVDELRLHSLPRGELWTHARVRRGQGSRSDTLVADVTVVDPQGRVLVDVLGLRFRFLARGRLAAMPRSAAPAPASIAITPSVGAAPPVYVTRWQVDEPAPAAAGRTCPVVILGGDPSLAQALATALRVRGRVAIVLRFAGEPTTDEAALDPLSEAAWSAHWTRVAERITALRPSDGRGSLDVDVVHLEGTLRDRHAGGAAIVARVALLLRAYASALRSPVAGGARFSLVTAAAQRVGSSTIAPDASPLWGFARAAAAESPSRWGRLVDVDPAGCARDLGATIADLLSAEAGEREVALRGGERLVPRLVRVEPAALRPLHIRPEARYLITGGLGSLGAACAQWLVDRGARHLVLLGRTATSKADPAIEALRARGADVRVEAVDVADAGAMTAFATREAVRAPLAGILHAAGVLEMSVADALDEAALARVMRPKVAGSIHLAELFADAPLDFFLFFSSLSALVGSPRLAAYASANAFEDALAIALRARGVRATSIAWGAWADTRMVERVAGPRLADAWTLSSAEGLAALERVLALEEASVVVPGGAEWETRVRAQPAWRDLPILRGLANAAGVEPARPRAAVLELLAAAGPAADAVVRARLRSIAARIFEVPEVRLTDRLRLSDVGLDSLLAMTLQEHVEVELGVVLPLPILLGNPTIAELADAVGDLLSASGDAGAIAAGASGKHPASIAGEDEAARGVDTPPVMHRFPSRDGLEIYGHLSIPAGHGPHPAVLVHAPEYGGGLDASGRHHRIFAHRHLVREGFAVFTVDQRGAPGHGAEYMSRLELGGADIDDMLAARDYLGALPQIDDRRVALLGTSRGAYAALLAALRAPGAFRAAILAMGFYDAPLYVRDERAARPRHSALLFFQRDGWEAIARRFADPARNPLARIEALAIPLRVIHGDADRSVPHEHALRLSSAVRARGGSIEVEIVPGLDHDLDQRHPSWSALWRAHVAFLTKHLSPAEDPITPE
jgi:dienelactone hydrolase/short-subunit dehydrogenase/acyl carrier protein